MRPTAVLSRDSEVRLQFLTDFVPCPVRVEGFGQFEMLFACENSSETESRLFKLRLCQPDISIMFSHWIAKGVIAPQNGNKIKSKC